MKPRLSITGLCAIACLARIACGQLTCGSIICRDAIGARFRFPPFGAALRRGRDGVAGGSEIPKLLHCLAAGLTSV